MFLLASVFLAISPSRHTRGRSANSSSVEQWTDRMGWRPTLRFGCFSSVAPPPSADARWCQLSLFLWQRFGYRLRAHALIIRAADLWEWSRRAPFTDAPLYGRLGALGRAVGSLCVRAVD